jgi:hypothetical protein
MGIRFRSAKTYAGPAGAGFVAGLAIFAVSFVVLYLIGLIPSQAIWKFFGSGGHGPLIARLSGAVLAPFNGVSHASWTDANGHSTSLSAAAGFGGMLVLFAALSLVGRALRRRVPSSLRERSLALAVTGLTVACGTLAVALLRFTIPTSGLQGGLHEYRAAGSYFLAALLLTLLLGAFTFGVVNLLPRSFAGALRRAGVFVGIAFVAFGVLFPVFVVSDHLPGARIPEDFGRASGYSAAVGGFAIPLALQAPVSVQQRNNSPWIDYQSGRHGAMQPVFHREQLAVASVVHHPRGRLFQLAASLGASGSIVGAAITLVVLVALALTTIGLCRSAAATTPKGGLRLGIWLGGGIALLVILASFVTSFSLKYDLGGLPQGSGRTDLWRTTWFGLAQTAVTLIVFCAAVGAVYGWRKARGARTAEPMSAAATE